MHKDCVDKPTPRKCAICGKDIAEGDEYAIIKANHYHMDCLAEIHFTELLELCGVQVLNSLDVEGE